MPRAKEGTVRLFLLELRVSNDGGGEESKGYSSLSNYQRLLNAQVLSIVPHTVGLACRSYWPQNDLR